MTDKCAHCGNDGADNEWRVEACADNVDKRTMLLCDPCDLELNKRVLFFFRVPNAEQLIKDYRKSDG